MKNPQIARIINDDQWTVAQGDSDGMSVVIRFREALLGITDTEGYEQILIILWPYADEGSGTLPTPEITTELDEFEEHLCTAFERDAHAVVSAVVTADGARQWIVYTGDVNECGLRIANMPEGDEPYPIEMQTDEDPEWSHFRETVSSESDEREG